MIQRQSIVLNIYNYTNLQLSAKCIPSVGLLSCTSYSLTSNDVYHKWLLVHLLPENQWDLIRGTQLIFNYYICSESRLYPTYFKQFL